MSRIGKLPVPVPTGVTITITGNLVTVKGTRGELKHTFHPRVKIAQEGANIIVTPVGESRMALQLWGLSRTLMANMIQGVTKGFERELIMKGVGYKVVPKGSDLDLALGFSHPVVYKAPKGITFEVDSKKLIIKILGNDKQMVGQVASEIRSLRPPEPYKGKGIAYSDETIVRKAGKTAGK